MKDYIITRAPEDNDELQHYGVLGMKWGVRRANKRYSTSSNSTDRGKAKAKLDKHIVKADKKLNKLDNKIVKKYSKAEKAYNKYTKFAGRSAFLDLNLRLRRKNENLKLLMLDMPTALIKLINGIRTWRTFSKTLQLISPVNSRLLGRNTQKL